MSDDNLFSPEYSPTSTTEKSTTIHEKEEGKESEGASFDDELKQYGISKPRRIMIKAILSND